MTHSEFIERIPKATRGKSSASTLRVWYLIHSYVCTHGQTDRYDRDLSKHLRADDDKWLSEQTVQRHLKRMTDAGLLQGHSIRVRYTELGRAFWGFNAFLGHDGPPPGVFVRYTLPGMLPILDEKKKAMKDTKHAPNTALEPTGTAPVTSTEP